LKSSGKIYQDLGKAIRAAKSFETMALLYEKNLKLDQALIYCKLSAELYAEANET
jgi:hypothetical protein